LRELITRVDGFPRALEAAVGLLAGSATLTLAELLKDAERFGDEVTVHIVEEALKTLSPLRMRVMEALALLGQPVSLSVVEYVLAPYADWTRIKLRDVLDQLIERRFVSYNVTTQRYSLHPLDREYCEKRIPQGAPDDVDDAPPVYSRYALNARAAHFFETQRKPQTEWKTLADLEPQLSEFEYRVRLGDYDTATSLLLAFDFDCLLLWGHVRLVVTLHERLLGKVRDSNLQNGHLGNLATAYYSLSEVRKAIEYYEKALAIAREIGNKRGEGAWLGNLGNAYSNLGDVHKAIEYYEQALAISREIGDKRGEGNGLGNLGVAYGNLGEAWRAITYYEQALAISREIGDKRGEVNGFGNLGIAYGDLGEMPKAIEYYKQALAIAREIGDKGGEGNQLGHLGNAYGILGYLHKALEYYEQALTIAREIGDKYTEGGLLGNISTNYHVLGDFPKAIDYCQQAVAIAREIGDKGGEGNHLGNIGLAYFFQGETRKAIEYYEQALAISREIGGKRSECFRLNYLGQAFATLGEYKRGIKALHQSLTIADEIQDPRLKNVIGTDLTQAHLLQGDLPTAHQAIEAARQFDIPDNNHNAAALHGVIEMRLGNSVMAQTAFTEAAAFADELLKQPLVDYEVRYARALAKAGLVFIASSSLDAAKADYEAALVQCNAKGVVQQQLRLLEELAKAPNGERLAPLIALLKERL
jgi:tetratricopeptide (TPR) repeat protein